MKFVPNLGNGKIIFPKESVLKDEYDEWLSRIICYAFSLPPNALIKQVNRASAEQIATSAKQEGQLPRMNFIASQIDHLIAAYLKRPGVKFSWKTDPAVDPLVRANATAIYVDRKVITPDEARADDLGKAPLTAAQREELHPPMPEPLVPGAQPFGGKPELEELKVIKVEAAPVTVNMGDNFIRVTPERLEKRAA